MNKQIAQYLEKDAQIKRLKESVDAERFEILMDRLNDIADTQNEILDIVSRNENCIECNKEHEEQWQEEIEALKDALGDAIGHIEYLEHKISKLTKKNKKLKKQVILEEDEV